MAYDRGRNGHELKPRSERWREAKRRGSKRNRTKGYFQMGDAKKKVTIMLELPIIDRQ